MPIYTSHVIEVLDGLLVCVFSQIDEARNDDQAASGFVQSESDIAKIRVRYVLQFRQRACGPDADHRAASIKAPVQRFDSRSGLRFAEGDVDGGKDTAGEREQVR